MSAAFLLSFLLKHSLQALTRDIWVVGWGCVCCSIVVFKSKRHDMSATPLWIGWAVIVAIVWLGFVALIILFATLPNDSSISVCEQRRGGVEKTNDSQYVLGIVYRVFVTAVAVIIAVLFVIFGGWIVAMVRKLGKDKSSGATKVSTYRFPPLLWRSVPCIYVYMYILFHSLTHSLSLSLSLGGGG